MRLLVFISASKWVKTFLKNLPMKQVHHYSHHGRHRNKISFVRRLHLLVVLPVALVLCASVVFGLEFDQRIFTHIPWGLLLLQLTATFLRLFIAYALSVVCAIPLALWTQKSRRAEEFLLPVFDVLESFPMLAFFPVIVIFFIDIGYLNLAAVVMLFITMLWSIVFNLVSGLKAIPRDVFSVAKMFHIGGLRYLLDILFPALFPSFVTGSILAWAGGWNIIIVAEVLHAYVPSGVEVADLFGIGSALVSASTSGDKALFIAAISIIVTAIMLLNFFVWQKLLHFAERFKFE